ncbi:Peroxisomal membrane protein PAS20, partial [Massospora cicadina]
MAMVGVAEQFGMLKRMLFQILSLFSIYRWTRNFLYRCVGKRPPISPHEITSKEFDKFSKKPNYSFRPFVMFLVLVFGVPYLLHLFMRSVARRLTQQQQEYLNKQQSQVMGSLNNGSHTFEFAQATHDFCGQNPSELVFSKGDLIAIFSKGPPASDATQPQWWQGRLRDGRVGMFPSNRVEIIDKK